MRVDARRSRSGALAWPPAFAQAAPDREAALVLCALRGITPGRLLELAQQERTAAALLERIRAGIGGSVNDRATARRLDPRWIAESLAPTAARFVVVGDPEYPPQLEHLADPPLALFVRGRPLGHVSSMCAVVGARSCSDLGRDVARALGRGVAAAGVAVVSGAARGIDAASHEGALQLGGVTVAVLGAGIDARHPRGSRLLLDAIHERGTIVSEYPPGVPPEAFRFPARNRIIAALARAVVVVEGQDRSGSLISAEHALEIGREVFAVPGAIVNPLSAAPHRLIREGAVLIRGPDDLLEAFGLPTRDQAGAEELALPHDERRALAAVRGSVVPDRVAARLRVPVADALSLLLRLEMRGLVRSVGGRFERRLTPARPSVGARAAQVGLGRSGFGRRSGGPPVDA